MDYIPEGTNIHLANSTAIRYAQLFPVIKGSKYFCNRGTSGIDGSTSTALGSNFASKKPTVLLTGDIAFFYDSNAFWNSAEKYHFKVVLFNNSGGGIFRIIDGPDQTKQLKTHFETSHNLKAKKLAEMYDLEYCQASNSDDLDSALKTFLHPDNSAAGILEIFTNPEVNPVVLKDYFKSLKQ